MKQQFYSPKSRLNVNGNNNTNYLKPNTFVPLGAL